MPAPDLARSLPADEPADNAVGAVWRVRLLGGFELDDGRQRLQRLRSRATTALLARLAMAPHRAHGREELCALLWPEADAESGRARLRQTLSLLRALLEPPGRPPIIDADRRVLRVAPGVLWCDVAAFEQAARRGDTDAAQAWYRGDLLPGFNDEWVLEERTRLQTLARQLGPAARPLHAPARQVQPNPPSATTRPAAPHPRLPAYLTRVVGTEVSGPHLRALIQAHRLVTLLGAGGVGKTRLAVEVARAAIDGASAPEGRTSSAGFERALFVLLGGCSTGPALLAQLAAALGLESGPATVQHLTERLSSCRTLVVLDGCERLGVEATALMAALAEQSAPVHWLLTSRRPLGLDGEHGYMLPGLVLPEPAAGVEEASASPAIQLFVERARAHRPDFHIGANQCAALVGVVRWLDGLPLGIELAAAHARTLTPADMLALLQAPTQGLAWLARRGPRSGGDDRVASLHSVIEESWQLLGAGSRQFLQTLCHAPGSPSQPEAAAQTSADTNGLTTASERVALAELVAHCMVRLEDEPSGGRRYRVGEMVRAFVRGTTPTPDGLAATEPPT